MRVTAESGSLLLSQSYTFVYSYGTQWYGMCSCVILSAKFVVFPGSMNIEYSSCTYNY